MNGMVRTYQKPDLLIIGTQRGGTTSLFRYLMQIPVFKEPLLKEVHYFDLNYHRSTEWYLSHFPQIHIGKSKITGEASPYYLYHPDVPARVAEALPDVKLIVLLRNPIFRAYSQYTHSAKLEFETRSFVDAVNDEIQQILTGNHMPEPNTVEHRERSYVDRGIYLVQLQRWQQYFPQSQILLLISEDFFDNPQSTLREIMEFLGIEALDMKDSLFATHNQSLYSKHMSPETYKRLAEFYQPYNTQLESEFRLDLSRWSNE